MVKKDFIEWLDIESKLLSEKIRNNSKKRK